MKFQTDSGSLELVDERAAGYTFGSADNLRRYAQEINLSTEPRPSSMVGFVLEGQPRVVIGDFGGLTTVHEHSAVLVNGRLYVALAGRILCLDVPSLDFEQIIEADPMTCLGVHYEPTRQALISQGELEVARFNLDGSCVWRTSGPDIWTGPFGLEEDAIHATIWDKTPTRIDYDTGKVTVLKS